MKSFVREYSYNASEADSKITARSIALEQVKRLLLEEVGVFIHSQFEVEKSETLAAGTPQYRELTRSRLQAITAGITETRILAERWTGETYDIRAEITVDVGDVSRKVGSIAEDQRKLSDLEDSRRIADEALAEIGRLQNELRLAKTEVERLRAQKEYTAEADRLSATDWYEKAFAAIEAKHFTVAIAAFDQAVTLNPSFAKAYNNRGNVKFTLEEYGGAILDYDRAIELVPDYAIAYSNRGTARFRMGDLTGALKDFDRAIVLKADYAAAYSNRGAVKSDLGDPRGALNDYSMAIELNPAFGSAYYNRGLVRANLGDHKVAIEDYDRAIKLDPQDEETYYSRGVARESLDDLQGAIRDFDKAIELRSDYGNAYWMRGITYHRLGLISRGCEDLNEARRLGAAVPEQALAPCH